jgi:hypothetical protein
LNVGESAIRGGDRSERECWGIGDFDYFEPAVLPSRRFPRFLLAWKIPPCSSDATNPLPQSNAAAGTGKRPGQQKSSWTWARSIETGSFAEPSIFANPARSQDRRTHAINPSPHCYAAAATARRPGQQKSRRSRLSNRLEETSKLSKLVSQGLIWCFLCSSFLSRLLQSGFQRTKAKMGSCRRSFLGKIAFRYGLINWNRSVLSGAD